MGSYESPHRWLKNDHVGGTQQFELRRVHLGATIDWKVEVNVNAEI